jgi:hypothetical protein
LPRPSRVRSPRPQEDLECLRRVLPHLGARTLSRTPAGNVPTACSKPGLFNPWGLTAHALLHDACFVGARPSAIVAPGALPHVPSLPCLGHRLWIPLCFRHSRCKIVAGMTQENCWAVLLCCSDLSSQCNGDLRDAAVRAPLDCQCTPESVPSQSGDILPSTPGSSHVVFSQPKCTLFFSPLFVFRAALLIVFESFFLTVFLKRTVVLAVT